MGIVITLTITRSMEYFHNKGSVSPDPCYEIIINPGMESLNLYETSGSCKL
jgi:hypothetical protein